MSFTSWLRNVRSAHTPAQKARKRHRRPVRAATHRPRLEFLEDRCTPTTYSVTDLATLGGSYGMAADINASGQVVGMATLANGEDRAVLWQNGVATDLGTLGGPYSAASGINDAGQVVGGAFNTTPECHAVLWQNGVATDLGTLGGTYSYANTINASGQVVGFSYLTGNTIGHAFLLTPVNGVYFQDADLDGRNDFMTDLGTLGGSFSYAPDINASGQVVGSAYTGDATLHAFLITPVNGVYFQDANLDGRNDFMTDLDTLGSTSSAAASINDAGQVVGHARLNLIVGDDGYWTDDGYWINVEDALPIDPENPTYHLVWVPDPVFHSVPIYQEFERAFLWQDGVMTDLSLAAGYTDGIAYGINSAGQVVGSEWTSDSPGVDPGFLWQNGVTTDLTGQVPVGSLVPDAAQAINDVGQIVGYGYSPADGSSHALLLTPNSSLGSFLITSPYTATAGDAVTFTVTARSDSGTTLTDYTGTVSFASSDWQAALPAAYTFTAAEQGVHTFTATLKTAGWQTLGVVDTTYTGVIGSRYVDVAPGAVSQFTVAGFPSPRPVGAAGAFSVTAWDAFGNRAPSYRATSYTGTVHFTSTDSLATLPADYTFIAADFGTHTFSATFWTAGTQSITVTDLPNPSVTGTQSGILILPSITISDVTVTEGNTVTRTATFTVTLSAAYAQPITVTYATADGSATGGGDYQAASGTLTIPAGQTTGTITVPVNGDRLVEPNETFAVNLSAPTNATIADGQGIGTILDDEPRISINDATVTEGNTGTVNATFTVSLSAAYDVAVTVHCQTANGSATAGSDYVAASGDVTIAAGQTTKTFTVAVIGDRSAEPTENFVVDLSAATNGLIVDSQGVGAILDDEPRISIGDVTKAEGKNRTTTLFTFTVTLSAAYDQAVTMSFRTVGGTAKTSDSDYVAKTGTLTFAPGETTKTITIDVKGDSKKEADETFYLDLFGCSSNSLFTKNRGLGTILNDD